MGWTKLDGICGICELDKSQYFHNNIPSKCLTSLKKYCINSW